MLALEIIFDPVGAEEIGRYLVFSLASFSIIYPTVHGRNDGLGAGGVIFVDAFDAEWAARIFLRMLSHTAQMSLSRSLSALHGIGFSELVEGEVLECWHYDLHHAREVLFAGWLDMETVRHCESS